MVSARFSEDRTTGALPDLLRRYLHQETVEPLRAAGRCFLCGLVGASLLGLGTVLRVVGGLRALQASSLLDGSWSWVPYLAAALVLGAVAGLTVSHIGGRTNLDG